MKKFSIYLIFVFVLSKEKTKAVVFEKIKKQHVAIGFGTTMIISLVLCSLYRSSRKKKEEKVEYYDFDSSRDLPGDHGVPENFIDIEEVLKNKKE